MSGPGIVRFPRGVPKTLREWDQVFQPLNEIIQQTPEGTTIAGDNIPGNDVGYVTVSAAPGLEDSRQLVGKDGQTVVTDTGTEVEVSLAEKGTPGTYAKVVTDAFGRVVAGAVLKAADMPQPLNRFYQGTGSPNGVLVENPGAIYINIAGGAGTTLWVKQTGSSNTGWVGK